MRSTSGEPIVGTPPLGPRTVYKCGFEDFSDRCGFVTVEGPADGFTIGNFTPSDNTGPPANYGARGTCKYRKRLHEALAAPLCTVNALVNVPYPLKIKLEP